MDSSDNAPIIDLQAYRDHAAARPPADDALEASYHVSASAAVQVAGQWATIMPDEGLLQGHDPAETSGPVWLVLRWTRGQPQADLLAGPFPRAAALRYATVENWRLVHAVVGSHSF